MAKYELDIYKKNNSLSDAKEILKISLSLAYQKKVKSFYKVIAITIKELIDSGYLDDKSFRKLNNNFYKTKIDDNVVIFMKNNLFSDEEISLDDFLKQKLVKLYNKDIPSYLSSQEKEKLMNSEYREIINISYAKQELNSDKFPLVENTNKNNLINIFEKIGYYSITVKEYIDILSDKYDYNIYSQHRVFINTFNNYILEIGLYILNILD